MAVGGAISSKILAEAIFGLILSFMSSCLLSGKSQEFLHHCEFRTKKYPTLKSENRQNDRTGRSSVKPVACTAGGRWVEHNVNFNFLQKSVLAGFKIPCPSSTSDQCAGR